MHFFVSLRFSLSLNLHSISSERTRNEMAMEPRHVVCLSARFGGCFALLRARALTHTRTPRRALTLTLLRSHATRLAGRSYVRHACVCTSMRVRERERA